MAEKTYKVSVSRTIQQATIIEVSTDIDPNDLDFHNVAEEDVFPLEDYDWDTIYTGPSGIGNVKEVK